MDCYCFCDRRNVKEAVESGDERVVRAALGAGRVVDLKRAEVVGARKIRLQWEVSENLYISSQMGNSQGCHLIIDLID